MTPSVHFCPAKLNLYLAVTGRRADGFHALVSLVTPLAFGDDLAVEPAADFSLACDDPGVPVDASNLILRAAEAFRAASAWKGAARFRLTKRIPMGAGLGGGSSDAATALRALNELAGRPLAASALSDIAAKVGSDCPLFLADGPVVMRGRGERIQPLEPADAAGLRGRRVLIFKPAFGIATPWAYGRLAATAPESYKAERDAETELARVLAKARERDAGLAATLANSLEAPAFQKFTALPVLLRRLEKQFGLAARMSGTGSACFALLPDAVDTAAVQNAIREAWGESAWIVETTLG